MQALVIEQDAAHQAALTELIELHGCRATAVRTLEDARRLARQSPADVTFVNVNVADADQPRALGEFIGSGVGRVVVIAPQPDMDLAREALRAGAVACLTLPLDETEVRRVLQEFAQATSTEQPRVSAHLLDQPLVTNGRLISASSSIHDIQRMVEQVSRTDATVLIIGESGTGKDLVAQMIHEQSARAAFPFLPVNCGAISPGLVESELFGHERGSFTGAVRQHHGYFERADKGTLFLDEITEMSLEIQVRLLRVLETGRIQRVGGTTPIQVDARVIAATNRSPAESVAEGHFREDLFYRLNVFPVIIPPLRERPEDIEALSRHFLEQLNNAYHTDRRLTQAALGRLLAYHWPGNVRELKNVIYRAYILAGDQIEPAHIRMEPGDREHAATPFLSIRVGSSIAEVERRLIKATLESCQWDKRRAAEILGISLKTLYNRLNEYSTEPGTGSLHHADDKRAVDAAAVTRDN